MNNASETILGYAYGAEAVAKILGWLVESTISC
jgi:hypothetical protein